MRMTGQLNRRITLQTKTTTKDSFGADVVTWADLATVWAEWIPSPGSERWVSQLLLDTADGAFRAWYRSDFDALGQVVWNGDSYRVLAVQELGYREEMLIQVQRVVE